MFNPLGLVQKVPAWVLLAGAAGVAFYVIKKGGVTEAVQGVTAAVVGSAGSVVNGVTSGAVIGLGSVVGIPETNLTACQKAKQAGNNWDASKFCTASEFLAWQIEGAKIKAGRFFNF